MRAIGFWEPPSWAPRLYWVIDVPTSNGQVTGRDLRQKLLRSNHFPTDPVVETDFIQDLAVTFPDKIDAPIWSHAFGTHAAFSNESLSTTFQTFKDLTVDVPAWVDQVAVFAVGRFQITNTSGAEVAVYPGIEIDGEVQGGVTFEVPDSSTKSMMMFRVSNLSGVAGASFTITMEVALSTGTNSANFGLIGGIAVGGR